MAAAFQDLFGNSEDVAKDGTVAQTPPRLDLPKDLHEEIRMGSAIHEGVSLDDELGDAMNAQFPQHAQRAFDLLSPFVTVQELQQLLGCHRFVRIIVAGLCILLFRRQRLLKFIGNSLRQQRSVIECMPINKVIHVEPIVNGFADVQSVSFADHLDEAVRCHGVGGKAIQIEVRDPCLLATALEIVTLFLRFPTCLATPLLDEPITVGFDEGFGLIVLRFEKERHPEHRERYWSRGIGIWLGKNVLDRSIEMLLSNVPVWSQGVAHELDRDHERRCRRHEPHRMRSGRCCRTSLK
mmetsp:Transcript_17232/g.47732  ORF Transcript_17232/g.47732 Transcript_17232/m.47732 type:complete len:295 (-) Transcript_17232:227-1111(-)